MATAEEFSMNFRPLSVHSVGCGGGCFVGFLVGGFFCFVLFLNPSCLSVCVIGFALFLKL